MTKSEARLQRLRDALRQHAVQLPAAWQRLGNALWGEDAFAHAECLRALPTFVEGEVAGQAGSRLYPVVKHHLDCCGECAGEYLELLELVLMDVSDALPHRGAIPEPNLSFLLSFQ